MGVAEEGLEQEEQMSKTRRVIMSSAKTGTVKRSQVRAAARQIKQERETSSGCCLAKK